MTRIARSDLDLVTRVSAWFRANARDLPWRRPNVRSGYAALVSETMAQQTQIARVVERFEEFVQRFPTPRALAAADEQDVLSAWRGLGYYRRARNLHAAAKEVVERFAGEVPTSTAALSSLPGVGRYTAGAIASIVHGARTPIVDGNVGRVLLRVRGRDGALDEPSTQRWLWEEAAQMVALTEDPGSFNEGLMELGAMVCTPRTPRCLECPLRSACIAHREGAADRIPRPKKAAARRVVHHHAVVVRRGTKVLIEQRPTSGLWSSMWQAPTIESESALGVEAIARALRERLGDASAETAVLRRVGSFVHVTTHRDVRVTVHLVESRRRKGRWVDAAELESVPMGEAARKALGMAMATWSVLPR